VDSRSPVVTSLVAIIAVTALFAGCLFEEEKEPSPNPKALLTGPSEAWVGDIVDFDASASRDKGTEFNALNLSWDMGDGTVFWGKPFVSTSIATPNHTFEREGTYLVNLTVTDSWGNKGLANLTIFVRYQLNLTVNAQGTWLSEDTLNNTTYFNLTMKNEWVAQFDVPPVRCRLVNDTGGEVVPRAMTGDEVPANLTPGQSFTFQVHFRWPEEFEAVRLTVTEELQLDLTEGT
jgi:hypothetical protein